MKKEITIEEAIQELREESEFIRKQVKTEEDELFPDAMDIGIAALEFVKRTFRDCSDEAIKSILKMPIKIENKKPNSLELEEFWYGSHPVYEGEK